MAETSDQRTSTADNIPLAVGAIIFTVFALSVGDALIKRFSTSFPLWQIFILRSLIALPLLVTFIRLRYRDLSLMPRQLAWTGLRSVALAVMWVAYYAALPHLEFSIAAAAYYTLPLFITMFSAAFIGERVGLFGWFAVCLGFAGVLLILRPEADDFNTYALLPLLAAVLYASAMLLTRTKCRDEHPLIMSLALIITFVVMGAGASLTIWAMDLSEVETSTNPFLLGDWVALGWCEVGILCVLAASILIGSIGSGIAYQAGPSSIVATFDFGYLAFATLWGILFFAETPDVARVVGILLIATGGILAVRRRG